VNATKDGIQFSVGEAKKSLALTGPVYKLFGKPENLQHAIFEGPHDYSKAMREAMYGFMTLHLKGEGKGDPIPEPKFTTEKPEDLRCYPGDTRPKDFMTIPKFAAQEGNKLRDAVQMPKADADASKWGDWRSATQKPLRDLLGRGMNRPFETGERWKKVGDTRVCTFSPERGIVLTATLEPGKGKSHVFVLLNLEGAEAARKSDLYARLKAAGAWIITLDLRGTGKFAVTGERVGRAPDHNSAEWGLWLGRPLVGQWAADIQRLKEELSSGQEDPPFELADLKGETIYVGDGPAGSVLLACGAAWGGEFTRIVAVNAPATFVTDEPYNGQRLGVLAPAILRDVGDVGHLAAVCVLNPYGTPRVIIAGGVSGSGKSLTPNELAALYEPAARAANVERLQRRKEPGFVITTPENVLKELGIPGAEGKEKDEPIFEPGAKLTPLSAEGAGGEGPAWDPKLGVLTSGSKGIHQLTPEGEKKVWRDKAGTNGLLFDREGRLVCCEPVARVVSRIDRDGKRTVLTASFGGKKYNQPNDLTIDSKDRIYFSDPRYGNRDDMQQKDAQGNTIEGVYRIDTDGKVSRVIGREVERANGVLVSADDKYLFVADNNNDKPGGARKLWRFDLKPDGSVDPKSQKLLHDWGKGRGPDGVKQDSKGRLYVAGGLNKPNPPAEPAEDVKGGIYVIDPESGKLLAFVGVPTDEVTNCAFGGDDLKTLYITGGGTLYSIRTTTPGRVVWPTKK
jgi:gluconolactonase